VTLDFEGGHISSDRGVTLVGRLDRSYGYRRRFSWCFTDHRAGEKRHREEDREKGLAVKSTRNRLELTPEGTSSESRYKKSEVDVTAIEDNFIEE
jgi:hypothetical protein